MNSIKYTSEAILDFWFKEIKPTQWWSKSEKFDHLIGSRYKELHRSAERCELYHWRETVEGRLAEILILDQFSRNIYRDSPRAFACDNLALGLAQSAVASKWDLKLNSVQRAFLYMPYMHSESPMIHDVAVSLFSQEGMEGNLDFELRHKKIIDQLGRYPRRNEILGRVSTPKEMDFLATPNSSF